MSRAAAPSFNISGTLVLVQSTAITCWADPNKLFGMDDDGWTVVRGKGKGKGRSTPSKRARDECCPGGEPYRRSSPRSILLGINCPRGQRDLTLYANAPSTGECEPAVANDDMQAVGPLPLPREQAESTGGRRQGRRAFRERTPAEQCAYLVNAIVACRWGLAVPLTQVQAMHTG